MRWQIVISAGSEPVAGYKIIRKLGEGGFGAVLGGGGPRQRALAIKVIRLNTPHAQPELRALEIIRNVRHSNLLDVQFFVHLDDVVLIAMPLCDESLWDRLQACQKQGLRGVPKDELIGYMRELAKAVDFLNEKRHAAPDGTRIGIQHRDIKPHNIFLAGGSVRLADFGLAKLLGDNDVSHTGYMSPSYVAEASRGRSPRIAISTRWP